MRFHRAALLAICIAGCKPNAIAVATAPVLLHITTMRGAPVAGAEVLSGANVVTTSDREGRAQLHIGGLEGDTFQVEVRCPPPLKSPAPFPVRKLSIAGGEAEVDVKCDETRRDLVVVVRAENGPNLPILYLGKEVGRTDRSGSAHLDIDVDVHERVELTLSTDGEVGIHPENPSAAFEPSDSDEIRELAVTFTRDAKKKPRKTVPKGPTIF